jgi:hypothetical protein
MIEPKKVDINKLPKKLCDGALGGHNKEIFSFALTSGGELSSFAATPTTMKGIMVWMNEQVTKYEQAYGVIEMPHKNVTSPIQPSDLK